MPNTIIFSALADIFEIVKSIHMDFDWIISVDVAKSQDGRYKISEVDKQDENS